ncbi:NitT/TauT family transport system ATP-binding protein [Deinobacterium chartae]|uniref:NitT/TauT family transport system ATP-binding protein n=1 Tax=Deinobacterium chartae TaxID=521158 RepID=A0A841HZS1_9DEIO|nr:ABC transporter permease subunit [Deinobacterium chartae]MBB6098366.1 NitT/TauT family transport system ATP-binding protein [Deinobacterium chartae]
MGASVQQATDTVIALEDVSVTLGDNRVLENITLSVRRGEFLALIGPSGGGKSTLLRVIAGLIRPARGNRQVAEPPAFVFQDYRLLPWRTALDNVRLPREIGQGRGGLEAHEALHQVGMGAYGRLYPHQLSGGMRARVAVARALAQSSDIVLMDEPFAALDAMVRERFNEELRHLHEKTGRTTVFVTHSIREAVYLADRVAVLKDGRLQAIIDTREAGRVSAYTDGLEAQLRQMLGTGDSTRLVPPDRPARRPFEPLAALGVLAAVLLAWHLLSLRLTPFLLPGPLVVWNELLRAWPELSGQMLYTLSTTLVGLGAGGIAGMLLGYPLGRIPALERILSPFLVASQSTPTIVLAPLLITWLGFGWMPGVVVASLTAFYPLMVNTLIGVREVSRDYHELFDTLGATSWQRLRLLEAPGALPFLLGGLRLAASLALIGAVVWEFVSNAPGLGFAVNQARAYYNTPRQFAAILLLALMGGALYLIVTLIERRVLRHRRRA